MNTPRLTIAFLLAAVLAGPALFAQGGGGYKGMNDPKAKEKQFDALKQKKPVDVPVEEDPDFVKARDLFWSGNYEQAEIFFSNYLSRNPDHEPSKKFMQMIREAKHFDPEREKVVRKALEEVRFKRVEWKDLTLDQAINYIRDETRKQLPEGENVNFVNLVPQSAPTHKITLHTEDATLRELVREISAAAGVFHYVASDGIVFETKAQSI